jgi:hypothetical protein
MTSRITDPVTEISFRITFDPPRELQRGFCALMVVEYTDYGPSEPDERYGLRIQCKGRDKAQNGKPDMRTRDFGLILSDSHEDILLLIEELNGINDATDPQLAEIREFAKQRLEFFEQRQAERAEALLRELT